MPRKSNAKAKRAEISQALYRCILKNGYLNTTTRDIAREANLNKGLIHYYFESKEGILEELFANIFEKYQQNLLTIAENDLDKSPREKLRLRIDYVFGTITRDRDLTKVFYEFWNLSQHDEDLRKLVRALNRLYRKTFEDFISDCLGESHAQSISAHDLATFLVATFEGASVLWFTDSRGVSPSKLSKTTNQILDIILGSDE
jgi:AcrR family transcriptional regulator